MFLSSKMCHLRLQSKWPIRNYSTVNVFKKMEDIYTNLRLIRDPVDATHGRRSLAACAYDLYALLSYYHSNLLFHTAVVHWTDLQTTRNARICCELKSHRAIRVSNTGDNRSS